MSARHAWRGRVVVLVIVGLVSSLIALVAAPAAQADVALKVDFGTATTTPAPGYVLDFGEPYGDRTGANQGTGLTYGWVADGTATPLDLTGRGRERTGSQAQSDPRFNNFMHMQYPGTTYGSFEIAVPNGSYSVTVGVGDSGPHYDSTHAIVVEGAAVVPPFTPTADNRLKTGTNTVSISDGRLTVRPTGGTNTKISFIDITEVPAVPAAFPLNIDFGAQSSTPANGYLLDYGSSYGTRPSGFVYGWVDDATGAPLNLSANGRQRTGTEVTDTRLTNFVHMQYTQQSGGNPTPGAWEAAVPPGTYTVTVALGDAADNYDSRHAAVVEGQTAIAPFYPTASAKFRVGSVVAQVNDGRLTVRATGGTNTKIDYVTIEPWAAQNPSYPVKVDFGAATSSPPAGYLLDIGQAYGPKPAGMQFGWVTDGTSTPLDLSANGRQRTGTAVTDVRLTSLVHMQYPGSPPNGNPTPGAWELQVPDGIYNVTVAVGDAGEFYDSRHAIVVEGARAIAPSTPTPTNKFSVGEVNVRVIDGKLTVRPTGGANTKIAYIDVDQQDPTRPSVSAVTPANGTTSVIRDSSVTASLNLPNGAIVPETVTTDTVKAINSSTGAAVPGTVNTSGGGDVLVFTPTDPFEANTRFEFVATDEVRDVADKALIPWTSSFTTGNVLGGTGIPGVSFTKTAVAQTQQWVSLTIGPDRKLYGSTLDGYITRWTINADGTLANKQTISTVRALHGNADRTVIGLAFDPASTAGNLTLWVTDNVYYSGETNVPDFTSQIVKLNGPDLESAQVVVTGLPRSTRDHETNSIAFGPDGALYVTQGSNTGMGDPDIAWSNRPEDLLSAAVLRLDPAKLPAALPLDVTTAEGGGGYNPYSPDAPLTLHATGVRNAFDLVWHSNGNLYVPTNGSAANSNVPGTPDPLPIECSTTRPDLGTNGPWTYTGTRSNRIAPNPTDQTDWVYNVHQGGYYGHPNPRRCEYISHGGNPTSGSDPWQEPNYTVGVQPDRNFRADDVYDAGLHASADGTIEYKSDVFGSALKGKLLVIRFSAGKDIAVMDPSGPNGKIVSTILGVTGFTGFNNPLDLVQDPATGYIWVSELGGSRITLLRPVAP
jgi:Bacterial Ig-like domain